MIKSLHKIGHKPKFQGGNGKPTPVAQSLLAKRLGWPVEWIVSTGTRGCGIPTHYKIDIAHPSKKIAVEVDGFSHCALIRRQQDARKEKFLKNRGWKFLRFSNRYVIENLDLCVKKIKCF